MTPRHIARSRHHAERRSRRPDRVAGRHLPGASTPAGAPGASSDKQRIARSAAEGRLHIPTSTSPPRPPRRRRHCRDHLTDFRTASATYAAPTLQPPALQPSQSSPLVITAATEGHAQTATAAPSPATRATQPTPYAGRPSPGASLTAAVLQPSQSSPLVITAATEDHAQTATAAPSPATRAHFNTFSSCRVHCDRDSAPTQFSSFVAYLSRIFVAYYLVCLSRLCLFRFCV